MQRTVVLHQQSQDLICLLHFGALNGAKTGISLATFCDERRDNITNITFIAAIIYSEDMLALQIQKTMFDRKVFWFLYSVGEPPESVQTSQCSPKHVNIDLYDYY